MIISVHMFLGYVIEVNTRNRTFFAILNSLLGKVLYLLLLGIYN